MALPDLAGAVLDHYLVDERLGTGAVSAVYRATDRPADRPVALKVLDPELTGRPGFLPRFLDEAATLSRLEHPAILPIYEVATRGALTFLSMRLVRGGTLKALLDQRPLDPRTALRIVREVAGAVHCAHEAGVVHHHLKPSNVLLETDGSVLVADFGLAPVRYGLGSGGLEYAAPEQLAGGRADRRTDVYGLGLLLYEMTTGTLPDLGGDWPPPSAGSGGPPLAPAIEDVVLRALAPNPADRPETVAQFLDALGRAPLGSLQAKPGDDQLPALIEASPDPVFAVDPGGRIIHWNRRAERVLGWRRDEILGRPVLPTLIAPRHREPFERLLMEVAAGHAAGGGRLQEVVATRQDGRRLTLEISVSPVRGPGRTTRLVAFCRDISERKEAERLLAMQDAVHDAMVEVETSDQLVSRVLEAMCSALGWPAGAVWLAPEGRGALECRALWLAPALQGTELEARSRPGAVARDDDLPQRAWSSGRSIWRRRLDLLSGSERLRAAVRAGLGSAGAFPITDGGRVIGALEFFAAPGDPSATAVAEIEGVGRRLGRILHHSRRVGARRVRYRLDGRNSHLAFSCAFMRFMTVHGLFRDFSGWVELENDDPTTARAECTVKTASVDTGSLDRDYHLCSPDFFAVERYPDMVFRSTAVEPLGDERFRILGELTIRDVTRPIRLDVRLEDREIDAMGVERVTLTALTVINRLDWFLDWEKALQAGRWIVGNEVRLDLVIALVRRPQARDRIV